MRIEHRPCPALGILLRQVVADIVKVPVFVRPGELPRVMARSRAQTAPFPVDGNRRDGNVGLRREAGFDWGDGRVSVRELNLCQILRLGVARYIVTVFDFVEKEIAHLRM